jgi:Tol biopolymer transport system component
VKAIDLSELPTMSPDGSRIAYTDDGSIYMVDISTGETAKAAAEGSADWVANDTLLVDP